MPKRTISSKELRADVKAGLTRSELMEKYRLSDQQLDSVLKHLDPQIVSGVGLDARPGGPSSAPKSVNTVECPSCFQSYQADIDECPHCGIVRSKFRGGFSPGAGSYSSTSTDNVDDSSKSVNYGAKLLVTVVIAAVVAIPGFLGYKWYKSYKRGSEYHDLWKRVRPMIAGIPMERSPNWRIMKGNLQIALAGSEKSLKGEYASLAPKFQELFELMDTIDDTGSSARQLGQAKTHEQHVVRLQQELDKSLQREWELEKQCRDARKVVQTKSGTALEIDLSKVHVCKELEKQKKVSEKARMAWQEKWSSAPGSSDGLTAVNRQVVDLRNRINELCNATVAEMDKLH
jgi:hypothetical protein